MCWRSPEYTRYLTGECYSLLSLTDHIEKSTRPGNGVGRSGGEQGDKLLLTLIIVFLNKSNLYFFVLRLVWIVFSASFPNKI